ncbi:MAG: phosphotransferase [Patescibacteria group bacterium]
MQESIEKNYNIKIVKILPLETGALNRNYKITSSQGEFFLKEYVHQGEEELKLILTTEDYLHHKGVNIISNIKNSQGEAYTFIDNKRYVLYSFIHGIHPVRDNLSLDEVCELGKFLANFHAAGGVENIDLPRLPKINFESINSAKSIDKIDTLLSSDSVKSNLDILELLQIKKALIKNFTEIYSIELKADCIIHGDYQDQNIFYVKNKLKTEIFVFDIEKTKITSRYIEISRFILTVCFANKITPHAINLTKSFISGYSSVFEIDFMMIEKSLTYWFLKKINSTWAESEYLKDGKEIMLNFIKNDLLLLKQFESNQNFLSETFNKICE